MAWQDRPYYSSGQTGNPFMWLLTGSVPLFTVFGIRVRAHASLLLFILLGIFIGLPGTTGFRDNLASMAALFILVLLHEFGHCFTARWVGGEADEILMHPLGGLAMAHPPRRPLPTFLTILGGPGVNFLICVICGVIMWRVTGWVPYPLQARWHSWGHAPWVIQLTTYSWWIYYISLGLLLFNLLPIFPLDGGQMLQTVLWPWFGWYKSMSISCVVGMVGAVLGAIWSIYTRSTLLFFVALFGFIYCWSYRRQLAAVGPEEFGDETDYSAAYEQTKTHKPLSRWRARRARKRALKEARDIRIEQRNIDAVLQKVSAHGMQSLSWGERRILKRATERQRRGTAVHRR